MIELRWVIRYITINEPLGVSSVQGKNILQYRTHLWNPAEERQPWTDVPTVAE